MENLQTALDYIRYAATRLAANEIYCGHGTAMPLDDAAALVIGLLQLPFDIDPLYLQTRLTASEKQQLAAALEKRIGQRIPTPYLTRRTLYGGYEFYVDERVLIPRSPIAELLARDLAPYWREDAAPARILDLCCGSGCIGIVAKYRHPEAEVVLADLDAAALAVAGENLRRHGMEGAGIFTVQGDLFAAAEGTFDWILCNPPYVESAEMDDIAPEYLHEPRHALVSGADGLDLVRRILREAVAYLSEDGLLVLEVGMSWGNLEAAYPEIGFDWAEFSHGGEGVLVVGQDELAAWKLAGLL